MTDPAQPLDPLIGALLHGKYRLVRRIGSGGFGTVYEASDERGAGNRVAVKLLNKEFSSDANLVRAFRAEARRVTRLSHPNIVDWKNFDVDEHGICYFVMELVEGEEFDRVLERDRPLPPERAARILLQILDALRTAHHLAEGGSVLHLDLKPRNVFLVPGRPGRPEQVKVIDFGIGQHIGEEAEEEPALPGGSSGPGTSWVNEFNPSTLHFQESKVIDPPGLRRCHGCTPEYASPEQAAHVLGLPDVLPLDGRSDIYSLGVMGYQMLTGALPFARPVVRSDYLRLHLSGKPRRITATGVKVPRDLARFVERCLQKDRELRYPDAREAYAALERVVRPSLALRIGVAALVLVGAAFVLGRYLLRGEGRAEVLASANAGVLGLQNPLYLGPNQREAVLTLPRAGLVDGGSALTLVREGEATAVPGSSVELQSESKLLLALGAEGLGEPKGRQALSVRVATKGVSFAPFNIVWLGPDAWKLEGVRAGALEFGPETRTVEPQGLDLEVSLAVADRNDVARLSVQPDGGDERQLSASTFGESRLVYTLVLAQLKLHSGTEHITVTAVDRAGGHQVLPVPLEVVDSSLTAEANLCENGAAGGLEPFNAVQGRFLLAPDSKPVLRVEAVRPAALEWRLRLEGISGEPRWNQAPAAKLHEIEIPLPTAAENARLMGTLELRLDESALVVRADRARSLCSPTVKFEVTSEHADFDAWLEVPGTTPESLRLVEGKTSWVGSGSLKLVVRSVSRPAMMLKIDDGQTERSVKLMADQEEQPLNLELPGNASCTLKIQSFRFDTTAQSSAKRFDKECKFSIGVDTLPPQLSLPEGLDGRHFLTLDSLPDSVTPGRTVGDADSPVHVEWQLERQPDGLVRKGTWLSGEEPIQFRALWGEQGRLPDGDWRLELRAKDEAKNPAQPIESRFTVALVGPEVRFEAPVRGNWQPVNEKDGWLVQLRVSDPNGVDEATCIVRDENGEQLLVRLAQGAGPDELRGYVKLPHEWSKHNVRIEVEARDKEGQTNQPALFSGLVVPDIAPQKLPAVCDSDGHGAVMRLVRGNDAQYLFGGRGDEVEKAALRVAQLSTLAQSGTVRSWSVPYEKGEIGDYYLDEREVTRGDFLEFVRDPQGYAQAAHWPPGSEPPTQARQELQRSRLAGDLDLPVTDVTWEEACAFAHWSGRRLPTWIEFEYAVRGGPSAYRQYACFQGSPPAQGDVNAKGLGPGHPWTAGSSRDITPLTAIRDLAGNVREWTATPLLLSGDGDRETDDRGVYFNEHREQLLARTGNENCAKFWIAGGSFRQQFFFFEAAVAQPRRGFEADHVGFRCALSIEEVRAGLDSGRLVEAKEALK